MSALHRDQTGEADHEELTDQGAKRRASASPQPLPQQQPGLADRDHRAGDQHPRAGELALLLGERDRRLQSVVEPRLDLHPLVAEDLDGERGQLVGVHRAVGGVLGDHDLREDRLEGLQQAPYVLVAARPDHTDQPA